MVVEDGDLVLHPVDLGAVVVLHHGHLHLVQLVLEVAAEDGLAPAGGDAADAEEGLVPRRPRDGEAGRGEVAAGGRGGPGLGG